MRRPGLAVWVFDRVPFVRRANSVYAPSASAADVICTLTAELLMFTGAAVIGMFVAVLMISTVPPIANWVVRSTRRSKMFVPPASRK